MTFALSLGRVRKKREKKHTHTHRRGAVSLYTFLTWCQEQHGPGTVLFFNFLSPCVCLLKDLVDEEEARGCHAHPPPFQPWSIYLHGVTAIATAMAAADEAAGRREVRRNLKLFKIILGLNLVSFPGSGGCLGIALRKSSVFFFVCVSYLTGIDAPSPFSAWIEGSIFGKTGTLVVLFLYSFLLKNFFFLPLNVCVCRSLLLLLLLLLLL